MKKIFNLAVIFAALMTAVSFTSCDTSEQDAIDEVGLQGLEQITVKEKGKYAFENQSIGVAGWFEVDSIGASKAKEKVVKLSIITTGKGTKETRETFYLGDDANHTSYLKWNGTTYEDVFQKDAEAAAADIVFCLSSETDAYIITSATVNSKVSAAGATKTLFAEKQ